MDEMRSGNGRPRDRIYRHPITVRITHWTNVLCVVLLLASGLQIFNAHPALYWGEVSHFDRPLLAMRAEARDGRPVGVTAILGWRFDTTGVLGLSRDEIGLPAARGFPAWLTLPGYQDLATGRRWHFFFAWLFLVNGLIYVVFTAASGRLRRVLLPSATELSGLPRAFASHLRLGFRRDAEGGRYNVLQQLAYLTMVFVALPLLILAGLAMSPAVDATFPWLPAALGGRQSARTVHFLAAAALVLFTLAHVAMVILAGAWNRLRSMVTGRYAPAPRRTSHDA